MDNQGGDLFASQVLINVEPHVSEFQADVGVQFASGNFIEQATIKRTAGAGFLYAGDIFTEIINGNAEAGLIHELRGAENVFGLGPGDETAGEAAAERKSARQPRARNDWRRAR